MNFHRNVFLHGENNLVIGDLGHVKGFESTGASNSTNSNSNRVFGTNNYLAPEANDRLKRTLKIDIWSFGCIVYELFHLEKLFNHRDPDELRESIRNFNIDQLKLDTAKINPNFVKILKK